MSTATYYLEIGVDTTQWWVSSAAAYQTISDIDATYTERDLWPWHRTATGDLTASFAAGETSERYLQYLGNAQVFWTPPLLAAAAVRGSVRAEVHIVDSGPNITFHAHLLRYSEAGVQTEIGTGTRAGGTANTIFVTVAGSGTNYYKGDRIGLALTVHRTSGTGAETVTVPGKHATGGIYSYARLLLPVSVNVVTAVTDVVSTWNEQGMVTKDVDSSWAVYALISKDVDSAWNVYTYVEKDVNSSWVVESNLSTITKDTSSSWNVFTAVSKDVSSSWNVLADILSSVVTSSGNTLKYTGGDFTISKYTSGDLEVRQ
jgi:hypothetical protein